jgi:hypothetical protein
MSNIALSWMVGYGENARGGNKWNATWEDILEVLSGVINEKTGSVTLDLIDAPEIGPQSLQMQAEKGYFILLLGEAEDDDDDVRSYTNQASNIQQSQVYILGNLWSSQSICTDPEIVVKVFHEFFTTGDVSRDLLD